MAKTRVAASWVNWVDMPGVTFEASSEALALPASNLADEDIAQVWAVTDLSAGSTDFHVDIDLLQPSEIGVIALVLGWRLDRPSKLRETPMMAATDKVRFFIDGAADDFGTGAVADSGSLDCNIDPYLGYHVWLPETAVTGQKIRVSIDAVSRADAGFWWGTRLWAGPLTQFIRGHQFGHVEKWTTNAFDEAARAPTIPLQRIKASEKEGFLRGEQMTLEKRQLLLIRDIANANTATIIGKRLDTPGLQSTFFNNSSTGLQLEETW